MVSEPATVMGHKLAIVMEVVEIGDPNFKAHISSLEKRTEEHRNELNEQRQAIQHLNDRCDRMEMILAQLVENMMEKKVHVNVSLCASFAPKAKVKDLVMAGLSTPASDLHAAGDDIQPIPMSPPLISLDPSPVNETHSNGVQKIENHSPKSETHSPIEVLSNYMPQTESFVKKREIPLCEGQNPEDWVYQVEKYFEYKQTPEEEKQSEALPCPQTMWLKFLFENPENCGCHPFENDSEQEMAIFKMVINKQFFSHDGLARTSAYNKMVEGLYRPRYYEALGTVILKRILLLVLIIDKAKSQSCRSLKYGIDGLDGGSPLMFSEKSSINSSHQLICEILSSDVMHGEGNLLAHLVIIGYKIPYQQSPVVEYDFRVTDLFDDLQDGVRLCRAIQLLHDPSILTKMVIPSDNRNEKLANQNQNAVGKDISQTLQGTLSSKCNTDFQRESAAVVIQTKFRGLHARRNFRKKMDAIRSLQAAVQTWLSVKHIVTLENWVKVCVVAELVCERTKLQWWLLAKIKVKEIEGIKQYTSEILTNLLQNSRENQNRPRQMNSVEVVLEGVAIIKSKGPTTLVVEEILMNLLDVLCCLLTPTKNKERFVNVEGMELMINIMKQRKYADWSAIRALDFYPTTCARNSNIHLEDKVSSKQEGIDKHLALVIRKKKCKRRG